MNKLKEFVKTPAFLIFLFFLFIAILGICLSAKKEYINALGCIVTLLLIIFGILLKNNIVYERENAELKKLVMENNKSFKDFKELLEKSLIITRL